MALVCILAVSVNSTLSVGVKLVGLAVPFVIGAILCWMISDRRLVICEGGVIVGGFFPGLAPFAMPHAAIEPRGVTCVSDVGRLVRLTGEQFGSTLLCFPQSRRGIVFDGPFAGDVRIRRALLADAMDSRVPNTVRGGKLWAVATTGSAERLVATWQQAMIAAGVSAAEQMAAVALPERSVGSTPQEAAQRVNGFVPR